MPDALLSLDDTVHPFQLEGLGISGRMVRLGPALEGLTAPHDYPPTVRTLVVETAALAATLASMLKYDGIFTLQAQGNGPVGLVMADVTSAGALRGYARYDAEQVASVDAGAAPVPSLLGGGYLSFTVDQGPDTDRYQGITELTGATVGDCAHTYFRQSEQLETAILVASAPDGSLSGALTIQRMPDVGGHDPSREDGRDDPRSAKELGETSDDAWRRAVILMSSLTPNELLDPAITAEELLFRLYHEDGVRVFGKRPLFHACRCSESKVHRTLKSFPSDEVADMADDGKVSVTCEFCKAEYVLELEELRDDDTP